MAGIIVFTPHKYYKNNKINEDEMGKEYNKRGTEKKFIQNVVLKA
jgi:hypothetical protein